MPPSVWDKSGAKSGILCVANMKQTEKIKSHTADATMFWEPVAKSAMLIYAAGCVFLALLGINNKSLMKATKVSSLVLHIDSKLNRSYRCFDI